MNTKIEALWKITIGVMNVRVLHFQATSQLRKHLRIVIIYFQFGTPVRIQQHENVRCCGELQCDKSDVLASRSAAVLHAYIGKISRVYLNLYAACTSHHLLIISKRDPEQIAIEESLIMADFSKIPPGATLDIKPFKAHVGK